MKTSPGIVFKLFRGVTALTAGLSLAACTAVQNGAIDASHHSAKQVGHAADARQAARPNFLVIVADDLGFADVGFNGARFATPNIDAIARSGMVLDHFYVSALCSPSRAGLLTGRYPHRYGIMGDTITPGSDFGLDPNEETIAAMLARAGYGRRAFIGKWHLGHRKPEYHPMNFGFTSFYGHYNGAIDYFTHKRAGEVDWHRDRSPSSDKGYSTDLLSEEAVRVIRGAHGDGKPWMIWLAYNAPHGPLQAKAEDLAAAGFDPSKPRFGERNDAAEGASFGVRGRGNTRRQTAIAMIGAMDRGIGTILDELRRTGQLDNTVILFTSDNGGPGRDGAADPAADNGALRGYKTQHYDGGVRVAAAIAWPARLRPRPRASVGSLSYVDIMPTFAALAGTKPARKVDGADISKNLSSGTVLSDRTLFIGEDYREAPAYGERFSRAPDALAGRAPAVLSGRWKLVGNRLYDIVADPSEGRDIAADHPDVVRRLHAEMARFTALRDVPRDRLNATKLPPLRQWKIPGSNR